MIATISAMLIRPVKTVVRYQDMGYERFRMYESQDQLSWTGENAYYEFIRMD